MDKTENGLLQKEEIALLVYVETGRVGEAIKAAGYSETNPTTAWRRILAKPEAQKRLKELRNIRVAGIEVTARQVTSELWLLQMQARAQSDFSTAFKCLDRLLDWTAEIPTDKPEDTAASENDEEAVKVEAAQRASGLRKALEKRASVQ